MGAEQTMDSISCKLIIVFDLALRYLESYERSSTEKEEGDDYVQEVRFDANLVLPPFFFKNTG